MSGYLYFYGQSDVVSEIAERINSAGSAFHDTAYWSDSEGGEKSHSDTIQDALNSADETIAALRAEVEQLRVDAGHLWHALKDLSFDCDGVTQTVAPQRGTYNATFLVIQRMADKYQSSAHYQARKESANG